MVTAVTQFLQALYYMRLQTLVTQMCCFKVFSPRNSGLVCKALLNGVGWFGV